MRWRYAVTQQRTHMPASISRLSASQHYVGCRPHFILGSVMPWLALNVVVHDPRQLLCTNTSHNFPTVDPPGSSGSFSHAAYAEMYPFSRSGCRCLGIRAVRVEQGSPVLTSSLRYWRPQRLQPSADLVVKMCEVWNLRQLWLLINT